jgi:hypothetical protein
LFNVNKPIPRYLHFGYKQGERKFVKICDLNIGLSDFITNFVPIENSLVVVVIGYRFEPKE